MKTARTFVIAGIIAACSTFAHASLINGSFETGDYTGWTLESDAGSYSTWGIASDGETIGYDDALYDYRSGETHYSYSPGMPMTFATTDGDYMAYHIVDGPGTHRMYQDVFVTPGNAVVSWDMFYTDHNGYLENGSQNLVVSIRDMETDMILRELVNLANESLPTQAPMSHYEFDISEFAGQTVRFDVGLDIQYYYMDAGFDNIAVGGSDVPEPATMTLLGIGGASLLINRKKHANT